MKQKEIFYPIVVVGAGAAGIFAAMRAAKLLGKNKVLVLERSAKALAKLKISGGGRCNVSHALFDIREFIKNYPRGGCELLGPFHQFHVKDLIAWFEERGLYLKAEKDGRMFPVTDSSQSIIDCFFEEMNNLGVAIEYSKKIETIEKKPDGRFQVCGEGFCIWAQKLLLATGSNPASYALAKAFSHTIVTPNPSLFSFNLPQSDLLDLSGISLDEVEISLPEIKKQARGAILLTHWGFSGPGVLRLSAFAARDLFDLNYQTSLKIDWLVHYSEQECMEIIFQKCKSSKRKVAKDPITSLFPTSLWTRFIKLLEIPEDKFWKDLSKKSRQKIVQKLKQDLYQISGTSRFKQEFVTAGGLSLKEINFKNMESKLESGLYFAGELLDIDGVTGGFNFQAAWTCGYIAATSMARSILEKEKLF